MCTIAFIVDVLPGAPLVLAANRDELYARPTRPPELLLSDPRTAGGVDELSGGTWLAVRADGRFAAVTNFHALETPPAGLRSRGLVVRELAAAEDPEAYVAAIDPRGYASMNLAWGDARGVSLAYGRREAGTLEVVRVPRGIHVLCNDRLGASGYPRGERLARAIEASPPTWPAIVGSLTTALADHTRVPRASVPASHLPPELARELTATCIHTELYGTRSASIVAFGDRVTYLHADGPPCTAAFVDRSGLLS